MALALFLASPSPSVTTKNEFFPSSGGHRQQAYLYISPPPPNAFIGRFERSLKQTVPCCAYVVRTLLVHIYDSTYKNSLLEV